MKSILNYFLKFNYTIIIINLINIILIIKYNISYFVLKYIDL